MHTSLLRIICACPVLLTAASAAAQQSAPPAPHRPALLRVGLGGSWLGTGDYYVPKASVEYAPQFGRHLRLGARLAYLSKSHPYVFGPGYTIPQSYRALNLEHEVYWLPIAAGKGVEIGLGAGVFGGYARQDGFRWARLTPDEGFRYDADKVRGFHVGYLASVNVDLALDPERTWRFGARLAVQNDTRGNVLPGAQFQFSRAW